MWIVKMYTQGLFEKEGLKSTNKKKLFKNSFFLFVQSSNFLIA